MDGSYYEDHAPLMTSTINPEMVVLTNVSLDHIGLVNSIEDVYQEVSGSIRFSKICYLKNRTTNSKMGESLPSSIDISHYEDGSSLEYRTDEAIEPQSGIFNLAIHHQEDKLPFKSPISSEHRQQFKQL